MIKSTFLLSVVLAAVIEFSSAFSPQQRQGVQRNVGVKMAPKFDAATQRWIPITEDEKTSTYGPVGSLIRAGPLPFFQRIVNADEYEQAVLKFMAQDGCDRKTAQGNMDAYLENPQDWAYQRMAERNGAPKKDFANANTSPKQLVLTGTWSILVFWFAKEFISKLI